MELYKKFNIASQYVFLAGCVFFSIYGILWLAFIVKVQPLIVITIVDFFTSALLDLVGNIARLCERRRLKYARYAKEVGKNYGDFMASVYRKERALRGK